MILRHLLALSCGISFWVGSANGDVGDVTDLMVYQYGRPAGLEATAEQLTGGGFMNSDAEWNVTFKNVDKGKTYSVNLNLKYFLKKKGTSITHPLAFVLKPGRTKTVQIIAMTGAGIRIDDLNTEEVELTPPRDERNDAIVREGGQSALAESMYAVAPNATYNDLDCTEFIFAALKNAGFNVKGDVRTRIFMSDVDWSDFESLLADKSPKLGGAATALVSSNQGRYITQPEDIRPGDVVQYYYVKARGEVYGHVGIVERVGRNGVVDLYGSHRSLGGVGTLKSVDLLDVRKAIIARPNR